MAYVNTVLIANRGEIALRIQRTAHEMGYKTVAIYSEGDANDVFVRSADIAIALKGKTSSETYLDTEQILAACALSGANAVHPGYGFLSENAEFAQQVIDAGLIWVGPSVQAIKKMGDKLSAKALMEKANVPVLSGIEITATTAYAEKAKKLGYPVLIKASAGGGGKGMRVVEDASQLDESIAAAKREAKAAFGNETVFLERWLTNTRHIEVQILGDQEGNLVHCFERECSIQRRHQKVIEEAPSSAVSESVRERLGDAALTVASTIGYYSTGTVEFLLSGEDFYFLEVNTRLQVEHPVTEAITGLDLVREQFRIAEGQALGFSQNDLRINGHAIEARLYAEDPAKNFLPSPGVISVWEPANLAGVRYDSGAESGSEISMEFDPMVAKVIAWAPTRREASAKLSRALSNTRLQGITSNQSYLIEILRTPEFLSGDTSTDFIERVKPNTKETIDRQSVHFALIATMIAKRCINQSSSKVLHSIPRAWSNSKLVMDKICFVLDGAEYRIGYELSRNQELLFEIDSDTYLVSVNSSTQSDMDFCVNGLRTQWKVQKINSKWFLHDGFTALEFTEQARFQNQKELVSEGDLASPMPSVVQIIKVKVGDEVKQGDVLILLESMKMELQIKATRDGIISNINAKKGANVETGEVLVSLEALHQTDNEALLKLAEIEPDETSKRDSKALV